MQYSRVVAVTVSVILYSLYRTAYPAKEKIDISLSTSTPGQNQTKFGYPINHPQLTIRHPGSSKRPYDVDYIINCHDEESILTVTVLDMWLPCREGFIYLHAGHATWGMGTPEQQPMAMCNNTLGQATVRFNDRPVKIARGPFQAVCQNTKITLVTYPPFDPMSNTRAVLLATVIPPSKKKGHLLAIILSPILIVLIFCPLLACLLRLWWKRRKLRLICEKIKKNEEENINLDERLVAEQEAILSNFRADVHSAPRNPGGGTGEETAAAEGGEGTAEDASGGGLMERRNKSKAPKDRHIDGFRVWSTGTTIVGDGEITRAEDDENDGT